MTHHPLEWVHWLMSLIGAATMLLLILPTPAKFAEIFIFSKPPRAYIAFYNVVRYVATLNPSAGWQKVRTDSTGMPEKEPNA